MLNNNQTGRWLITYGFKWNKPDGSTHIKQATYTVNSQLKLDAWISVLEEHFILIDVQEVTA